MAGRYKWGEGQKKKNGKWVQQRKRFSNEQKIDKQMESSGHFAAKKDLRSGARPLF